MNATVLYFVAIYQNRKLTKAEIAATQPYFVIPLLRLSSSETDRPEKENSGGGLRGRI